MLEGLFHYECDGHTTPTGIHGENAGLPKTKRVIIQDQRRGLRHLFDKFNNSNNQGNHRDKV